MIVTKNASRLVRRMTRYFRSRYEKKQLSLLATRHADIKVTVPKKPYELLLVDDIKVYSIKTKSSDPNIIYLHGGAYVHPGDELHFRFLKKLSKQLPANVYFIAYPLAPDSDVQHTTKKTVDVIRSIQSLWYAPTWIVGDSAGGGLALAIANQLEDISGYVLQSPWVDVSLSNPSLRDGAVTDGFFSVDELRECGHQYAHNDTMIPLASPLFQETVPHENIHIFTGTADLLHADIIRYEKKFPSVQLYVYKDAPHVFTLFPFSKEQSDIINLLKELTKSR